MKPVLLEFCGINSFSEPAVIDFGHLLEFGIFGIFGDTGSGKSTILDCIGFALYGNISRSRTGSIADVINDKKDRAYVNFTFEIVFEGRRRTFRVERELRRKNAAQSVKVYELCGNVFSAAAEGVRESNALLERIVGLEQKDFEKCIALPQGEFAQFVKAARSDRLKLVSRLFDLDAYGDGLVRRAGARLQAAREALGLVNARLEQYAALSDESNAALADQVARLKEESAARQRELNDLSEQEKALAARVELRRVREKTAAEMELLEARRAEMKLLNDELGRLERAAEAVKADRAAADAQKSLLEVRRQLDTVQKNRVAAERACSAAATWDEAAADAQIDALAQSAAAAKAAQAFTEERGRLIAELDEIGRRHATEMQCFRDFSYDDERRMLESKLAALGDGDLLSFAERHARELFCGEYAVFVCELQALTADHPEIGADTAPLIEKYSALSQGDRADLDRLRTAYQSEKAQREQIRKQLLELEKANGRYKVHQALLQQIETERGQKRARLAQLPPPEEGALRPEEAERLLAEARAQKKKRSAEKRAADETLRAAQAAQVRAEAECSTAETLVRAAEERLAEALAAGGFADAGAARMLSQKYGDPAAARTRVEAYREQYAAVRARLRELSKEDLTGATDEALAALRQSLSATKDRAQACADALAVSQDALRRAEEGLKAKRELEKERAKNEAETALYERLKKLLDGNKFMEFVAEEYLQTVAANAGRRLLSLTDGRYFLRYDGGFFVGDNFNEGKPRAVYTLSGGETFLVSLSLALALSDEICARSLRPIEFFFLDEGFGTLDEHLVDTVMDSLEKLKSEHFSIGIISHVEELKHRIDRKLYVRKATEKRGSQIQTE